MKLANTAAGYGVVSRILHWLVAALILGLIALGAWMVELSYYDRWYNDALALHKSLGMVALVLGALEVLWYLANRRVPFAPGVATYERALARTVHVLFLVLMVVIPLSGYLVSTSAGRGVAVFGLLEVPPVLGGDDTWRNLAIDVHYYAAYGAVALVVLHAGGALKHQLVDRDGTLRRMLW